MSKNESMNSSNIDKVLTILEEISNHSDGVSLAELVKQTDIPKTTAFRILETLKERQYVTLDVITERYILDLKSLELGMKGLMNVNLVEVAIPYLKKLSSKTAETCFLGVYNAGFVVYLYKSEGTLSIQTNAKTGRSPARVLHRHRQGAARLPAAGRDRSRAQRAANPLYRTHHRRQSGAVRNAGRYSP
ncbi:Pectin degradation repressor protein kdgR [Leminorella grimontii]|uniref:IclR family transcriptional regulator n=1 Tax=Leminorella grimontii TaxID=82981 RepID=UPI0010B5F33D|nr:Pectin degradation repressor protein kdgR [Leminorella grimontii]